LKRVLGQRVFYSRQCRASNILIPELKVVAELVGDNSQDKYCLLGDFGADAVTGEDREVEKHAA
jgi:hypothetical protein